MKKLLKNLILIICITIMYSNDVFGQERVDRGQISFSKYSEVLKEADGWYYNETDGRWVKNINVLRDRDDRTPSMRMVSRTQHI